MRIQISVIKIFNRKGEDVIAFIEGKVLEKNPDCAGKLYMATTKARHIYTEVAYEPDGYLMFGKESAGIPEEILVKYEDYCMRIPMEYNIRSLNLSNSVAIVLYEALRQHQFAQMELQGHLHRLHWHEE